MQNKKQVYIIIGFALVALVGGGFLIWNFFFKPDPIGGDVPSSFILSSNAGDPEFDGDFQLTWTASTDAKEYMVFSYISPINSINASLTHEGLTSNTYLPITGKPLGSYHFVVQAWNDLGAKFICYV